MFTARGLGLYTGVVVVVGKDGAHSQIKQAHRNKLL